MNERLPYLREKTLKLTSSPGIYRMRDKDGGIIYIGKAKNLKNRVSSYFRDTDLHPPRTVKMVSLVHDYDFIVTDTEYEALLLECSLIKRHQPKYNILLKDDKGYGYIKISDGPYPKITYETSNAGGGTFLGPYLSLYTARRAVEEANRIFTLPVCKKRFPEDFGHGRPCLNYHIGLCMGVCSGRINERKYGVAAGQAVEYIKNGAEASVEALTGQMNAAADNLDFELAASLRDRIKLIKRAAEREQKIFDDEMKDTDIISLSHNGADAAVAVIKYRNGRLSDKSEFFLGELDSPPKMLEDFIKAYYSDSEIPREIISEEETTPEIEKLLRERRGGAVTLSSKKRGRGFKLIMLAKQNAADLLAIKTGVTGKETAALEDLGKLLGLIKPPEYIEAYDISNLSGSSIVGGMTVFLNGRPLKKAYKRFSIKETSGVQDDYACMREVLTRRFNHLDDGEDEGFSRVPDLILLDGGKGHVSAAEPVLRELGIDVPMFGMVKDGKHRTRAIATNGGEISISGSKSAFMLITRIQDETHRFAITYQRNKRGKKALETGLTGIKGIGEKKAEKLFLKFKTRESFKNAAPEEIASTAGVNIEKAEEILNFVKNNL